VKARYSNVREAVVAFLRDELERRYQYENVSRFRQFKGMDPEVVSLFREFALRRIYPKGKGRSEIDRAFAALHEFLLSPRKMAALGSVALDAVWTLGRRLPAALSAAEYLVHAFNCASAVEDALVDAVLEREIPWKAGITLDDARPALRRVPSECSDAVIEALVRLLEISANRDTMESGMELLHMIARAMSGNAGQWKEQDRKGIALAMGTLNEAMRLFSEIDAEDAPRFIKGIEAVEKDWEKAMRRRK